MTFCHGMNKISDIWCLCCDFPFFKWLMWLNTSILIEDELVWTLTVQTWPITTKANKEQRAPVPFFVGYFCHWQLRFPLFKKRSKCHLHSKFVLIAWTDGDLWCGYSADRGERCRSVQFSVPWRTKQSYFVPTLARSVVFPLLSQPMKLENSWYL